MTFGMYPALIALAAALLPMAAQAQASAAANATRGGTLFKQRCAVCHSLVVDTGTRPGPSLKAVSGRKSGAVATFKYSPALKTANITWNKANLDQFLASPARRVPGTFMMSSVANPKDRGDLVAFLDMLKQ